MTELSNMRDLVATELSEVRTTLPGTVITWNGRLATVRPSIPKRLANGRVLQAPQIVSVPVHFPVGAGGSAMITVPLKPGDSVTLHFCERSMEQWLSGSQDAPDDPRQFDLTDAFATPHLAPFVAGADTENLSIQYGGGSIKISPSGDITMTGNVSINGNLAIAGGSMTHNGTNVSNTHVHSGVASGPDTTGAPQ